MRCNICDASLAQPRYNREIKTWEPCETCTEVITDTINSFKDNAVFTDDDFPSEIQQFPIHKNNT